MTNTGGNIFCRRFFRTPMLAINLLLISCVVAPVDPIQPRLDAFSYYEWLQVISDSEREQERQNLDNSNTSTLKRGLLFSLPQSSYNDNSKALQYLNRYLATIPVNGDIDKSGQHLAKLLIQIVSDRQQQQNRIDTLQQQEENLIRRLQQAKNKNTTLEQRLEGLKMIEQNINERVLPIETDE